MYIGLLAVLASRTTAKFIELTVSRNGSVEPSLTAVCRVNLGAGHPGSMHGGLDRDQICGAPEYRCVVTTPSALQEDNVYNAVS